MNDFHMWATFVVIAMSIVGYAWEKWSIEGVALATLAALLALFTLIPQSPTGPAATVVDANELIAGFANPALVTVLALLVIGQALFNTDALEKPAELMAKLGGRSVFRTILVLLFTAAVTSAFLNNTPVVVMFIPIIAAIAKQRGFHPTKALLPLSYVGILGGMTTLIGSSTNLLVAGVSARSGLELGFFDFIVPGLVMAGTGFLYVIFVMPWLLGNRDMPDESSALASGRHFVAQIDVTEGHRLVGEAAVAGLFPSLQGITVRSIYRPKKGPMQDGGTSGDQVILPPFEDLTLQPGDTIVVAATRRALTRALSEGAASLPQLAVEERDPERASDELGRLSESFTLAEAVVAPGSRLSGRTIDAARIRQTYGTMVLGLQRRSSVSRGMMRDNRLEPGDTLLVGGLPDDMERLRESRQLLLLERSAAEVPLRACAPRAIFIFVIVILLAATGVVPIVAASLIGAYAVIAAGCLSLRQAARSFDKQIFMLVGASLAAATAMEQTGGAGYLAMTTVDVFAGSSATIVLSALFIVTAGLTNVLSNNATAVLFTPIAIGIAQALNAPLEPFVIGILFAANCSFATPVAYQTNLLVLGPGRYRFVDYMRCGIPLIIILWIAFTVFVPAYYGL
ncbi:MAG: SLC13 family permease [Pseudomonadota bacterium]